LVLHATGSDPSAADEGRGPDFHWSSTRQDPVPSPRLRGEGRQSYATERNSAGSGGSFPSASLIATAAWCTSIPSPSA
jgi:hypothetical protein